MEEADINIRLRLVAEAIPHELFSWLNPLLLEAAEEIERLYAIEDNYEDVMSAAEDHRWD